MPLASESCASKSGRTFCNTSCWNASCSFSRRSVLSFLRPNGRPPFYHSLSLCELVQPYTDKTNQTNCIMRLQHHIRHDSRNYLALATSSRPLGGTGSECGKPGCQARRAFSLGSLERSAKRYVSFSEQQLWRCRCRQVVSGWQTREVFQMGWRTRLDTGFSFLRCVCQ
jgi:hypothetical protein